MASIFTKKNLILLIIGVLGTNVFAQSNVPLGIHYQAVARDNYGNELVNRRISVKFSIISGDPLGTTVFQELHQDVITSRFGVFSIIIGKGVPTGSAPFGELSQIAWDEAFHYLKVEVKFDNDFMDMGTMQFLAVPYALYAQRSLEPGPPGPQGAPGPKGDPGDPASDNQTLSVVNVAGSDYLAISEGNQVKISSIEKDGDPTNEIQDLTYDAVNRVLGLSKSATPSINLSELKNDADANPLNEIQTLSYNSDNHQLALSNGGGNATIDPLIAFRAGIQSNINLPDNTEVPIIFNLSTGYFYNDGADYNNTTGNFTPPYNGIYTFNVSLMLPANASVILKVAGREDEKIIGSLTSSGLYTGSMTMKLTPLNIMSVVVKQNNGFPINPFNFSGYFSGFRLY